MEHVVVVLTAVSLSAALLIISFLLGLPLILSLAILIAHSVFKWFPLDTEA